MKEIQIEYRSVDDLIPYINNPRLNEGAVEAVASSIKNFGFKNPIVVDGFGEIVNGHTRLKAAKKLGMDKVPVIVADDLTEDQVRAFRLADNKVAEIAEWDEELLRAEMEMIGLDLTQFGFEKIEDDFKDDFDPTDPYTQKIQTPVYEPTGEDVTISDLVDTSVRDELVRQIQMADIPEDVEEFLTMAAQRHLRFNYHNIAEYYANAPAEVQELFEDSALVIIDYDKAIEKGYVKLNTALQGMIEESEDE